MNCPICSTSTSNKTKTPTPSQLYHIHTERDNQRYYRCPDCHSLAMHPEHYLSREDEKARYLTHNNDVNDPGYQKFVRPVIQAVTTHLAPNHHGLDYGAGTGPVITKLLREKGYSMTCYDPIFIPNPKAVTPPTISSYVAKWPNIFTTPKLNSTVFTTYSTPADY